MELLTEAFAHWENKCEANLTGAFNNYRNLEEFESSSGKHFRDFLESQLDRQVEKTFRVLCGGNPVRSEG